MPAAEDPLSPEPVRFVWDEAKNLANIAKHGGDWERRLRVAVRVYAQAHIRA